MRGLEIMVFFFKFSLFEGPQKEKSFVSTNIFSNCIDLIVIAVHQPMG